MNGVEREMLVDEEEGEDEEGRKLLTGYRGSRLNSSEHKQI